MVALFVVLTLLFTYPISSAPNRYLNELADVRLNTWMLAWNAHAFITDPLHIFDTNIFFPNKGTLAYSEAFLAPALFVAPLNWAGYPVLAYNVVLLTSFLLSGVGATLWVRHLTGSLAGGIVAGLIWAFAPGKFDQLPHLHMMAGQWIPFALLFCSRYVESGRGRYLYATVAFASLQFAFSMHYGVFLLPILALYGTALLLLLPAAGARASLPKLARDVGMAGAVFAVLVVPVALPYTGVDYDVELQRDYGEMLRYSARPKSFLSGSPYNRAPHVRWLHNRYHWVEANYFPGVLPFVLAAVALFWLLPGALRAARAAGSARVTESDRAPPLATPRRWVRAGGVTLAAAAFILHVGGFVAAQQHDAAWAGPLMELCRAIHPALWTAVGATIALLAMSPVTLHKMPRWRVYLIVIGYLTLITYLLAYGPEVRGFGALLGRGPYWLLYRFFLPFQGIRAAGRIGLLWILFVAALAGFTVARLERRAVQGGTGQDQAMRRRAWRVAVVVLVAVLVWEFRVWPLPHEEADPAADPADTWLAQQSGSFSVVHAPIETGPAAWRETRYMLGSTVHWKWLVNGYSGFFPEDYQNLADTALLSPAFFKTLRSDFPVRYLLVHWERLANEAQKARLQRLLSPNDDAKWIAQHGLTYVFELTRDRGMGSYVRRRYTSEQLRNKDGIQFQVRGTQMATSENTIALAGWGDKMEVFEVSEAWLGKRVEMPEGFVDRLAGRPGLFEIRVLALVPLGGTGALIAAGFTADVHGDDAGVGFEATWLYETDGAGFQVHLLERYGTRIRTTREFPPTNEGALELRDYIAALPDGEIVAVTVSLGEWRPLEPAMVAGLLMLGADPPQGEVLRLVVVGRKGAAPGEALQDEHHTWASIDIEVASPTVQLIGIGLY